MHVTLEHVSLDALPLPAFARAVLSDRPRPRGLDIVVPARIGDVPRPAERFDADERERLAAALEVRIATLEPHVHVLDSVRRLALPHTSVVVCSSAPALLGGPLRTLWSALHATQLARELERVWSQPVVPLLWNRADAHDVDAVQPAWILNANLDWVRVGLPSMSPPWRRYGDLVLHDDAHRLSALRQLLRHTITASAHRDAAVDEFLPRAGASLARSFTRTMLELLGPLGVVVVEPAWLREDLSRALAHLVAVERGGPAASLRAGREAVRAAGHAWDEPLERVALVEHGGPGGARALRAGGDGLRYDDEPGSRTGAELAAEIVDAPGAWSAGSALESAVIDATLPVAAHVGGWNALARHAATAPLRARAGLPATPFVPRLGATFVTRECRTSLERLDLGVEDVLRARGAHSASEDENVPPVVAELRAIAQRAADELRERRHALAHVDRGLALQLRRTADEVSALVERICARAERVHANRAGKGRRHLRRVTQVLYPRELPQEATWTTLQIVARLGRGWIEELVGELDPLPSEHLLVHVDDDAPAPRESAP